MKSILKILYYILSLVATIAMIIILFWNPDWICRIHGDVTYVWYDGIWHAIWAFAHFIRDIFTDTNCMSHHGSTMYYVCFWLTLIFTCAAQIFISDSEEDVENYVISEDEKRLERLASTKMERMHNALANRVSVWFGEIESNSGKPLLPPELLKPTLSIPHVVLKTEKSINITYLITTQIMNFVFRENGNEYSLNNSDIKELHDLLYSTLNEHKIVCKDDEIDALIRLSLSFIDESLKASQNLYKQ